jgi:hypothetical protein
MTGAGDMHLAEFRPATDDVPVVCIVYNRARLVRTVIDRLRQIRPRRILIVADGPKSGNAADVEACRQVRADIDRIDWDCTVDRNYAGQNMGCRARILSGLDWAFSLVDRAIILEDDIDADPRFFRWAGRMLAAYEDRDDVAMLSGHNPLVWWPGVLPSGAGIPSVRGGIYGWATWRSRWRTVQAATLQPAGNRAADAVAARGFEPVVGALLTHYLEHAGQVKNLSWDVEWSLRMAMSGCIAIVSPVNLVHNLGLGPDATLTRDGDDMLFFLPRAAAPAPAVVDDLLAPAALRLLPVHAADRAYDRARVLIELLVSAREPRMARRLARHEDLPLDPATRLHLLPFRHAAETRHWLEHLAGAGVDANAIARWRRALGDAVSTPAAGVGA